MHAGRDIPGREVDGVVSEHGSCRVANEASRLRLQNRLCPGSLVSRQIDDVAPVAGVLCF